MRDALFWAAAVAACAGAAAFALHVAACREEPFSMAAVSSVCGKLRMDAIRLQHGDAVADKLVRACARASAAAEDPRSSVCVEGCDPATLCGLPATLGCSETSRATACDVTREEVTLDDPQWSGAPRLYRVRTGTCLLVSPSDSDWPVCRATHTLLRALASLPEAFSLATGAGAGSPDAPTPADWDVLFRPGRFVQLPLEPGAMPRPPDLTSQGYSPPVTVPAFYTHLTSVAPEGSQHSDSFFAASPDALQQMVSRPSPARGAAVTIAAAPASALRPGAELPGAPDPAGAEAAAIALLLTVDDERRLLVRLAGGVLLLGDGSVRVWRRTFPPGRRPHLDPASLAASRMWLGLPDALWAAEQARLGPGGPAA